MQKRTLVGLFLLTLLTVSWFAAYARASSISVRAHDDKISVELSLRFYQNMTDIPSISGAFAGEAATALRLALEESLKKQVGSILVSSLTGELKSTKDWINATIQFDIAGTSARKGDLVVVNCSWIPLSISQDLKLGNVSYNLIGTHYIKPVFEKFRDYQLPPLNETISEVMFNSGESEMMPFTTAIELAGSAALLDFRKLAKPIEQWERRYDVTKGLTTWTFNPGSAVDLRMTVYPRETSPYIRRALYSYNATISADGSAQAKANILTVDTYDAYRTILMLAVILVTLLAAVSTSWVYRSRRRQMVRKRR